MFRAALIVIVNYWKQPKWPSREKWINNWHTHATEYLFSNKKKQIII